MGGQCLRYITLHYTALRTPLLGVQNVRKLLSNEALPCSARPGTNLPGWCVNRSQRQPTVRRIDLALSHFQRERSVYPFCRSIFLVFHRDLAV